jgi:hypothetical protein
MHVARDRRAGLRARGRGVRILEHVTATATGSANSDFAVAQCMRAHNVPNFPDPSFGPGGYGIQLILPLVFRSGSLG